MMDKRKALGILAAFMAALSSCAAPAKRPLVDPFPLGFPLAEAGTLEIEGAVLGQPRARGAVVYFATGEGFLTAAVAPARSVLWRFKADLALAAGPELGRSCVLLRDEADTVYALDLRGSLLLKRSVAGPVTTPVREAEGRLLLGTADGVVMALDLTGRGETLWERRTGSAVTAGPVFDGANVLFGCADGRLHAFDLTGRAVWTFTARGGIAADPCADGRRVFFGTDERLFYGLDGATGKKKWSRRLEGSPVHAPVRRGGRLAVAASNSVVYILSARGGSILSWEAVSSRIVYEPCPSGAFVIVSSAAPGFSALDLVTARSAGRHSASAPLAAGALWVPPEVVLFEEDASSGRQRLVFLSRGTVSTAAEKK